MTSGGGADSSGCGPSHATNKSGPAMSSYHRKSQSLDAATISMQIGQTAASKNTSKSHSLKERYVQTI